MSQLTVFLSQKVKNILDAKERAELVNLIKNEVEAQLGVTVYPNLAASTVSGPEVSVNLDDVGNITGQKSDEVSLKIKDTIIGFMLLKGALLSSDELRVETSLRAVV